MTDIWSDSNRTSFMAITAHWIMLMASAQNLTQLTLCTDLIGFIYVPGRHTGEHLAHAFLYTLDRIHVTEKVVLPNILSKLH